MCFYDLNDLLDRCVRQAARSIVRSATKQHGTSSGGDVTLETIVTMGMVYITPLVEGGTPKVFFSVEVCMGTCEPVRVHFVKSVNIYVFTKYNYI